MLFFPRVEETVAEIHNELVIPRVSEFLARTNSASV